MQVTTQALEIDKVLQIAAQIGKRLKGGELIELIADVGGGKTTLTRALVTATGSTDHVTSPTFTISNIYEAPNFKIHHFDFYRLHEAGLIEHELGDVMDDPKAVVIVEWSDVIRHVLPKERLTIHLRVTGETLRSLTLDVPEILTYLVDDLPHTS